MVDGTGTSTHHYDELDRLTEATDGHGDSTGYEYDLAGDQTKITYPSGGSVERKFNEAGRLESVKDWLGNITSFAYDPDSNLTATTFPEGTGETDRYAYNSADQMNEAKFAKGEETLASLSYGRDHEGQVDATTSSGLPGEASTLSSYSPAKRLSKAGATAYEYDGAGNPTKLGSNTAAYDEASQLEHAGGTSYSFNQEGQRTKATPSSGPATSYGYDQAGNLSSVDRSGEGETPAIEDSYAYNGDGLRSSQTSGGTTKYLSWDQSARLPLILSDGSYSFIYGPADTPIAQIDAEGHVTYLHHDQQGSTRLLTGSTGEVEASSTYDAYGNQTGRTGTATTPLGYDGQYTSSDTDLIYLRARVYDPSTAQFLSVDPAEPITRAPYSYANDNSLNLADPSGLSVLGTLESAGETLLHAGLDIAAVPSYAIYYGSYELARGINSLGSEFGLPGEVVSHLVALPLSALEAQGLSGDALVDWIKGHTVNGESICDEGKVGYLNPLHEYLPTPLKGPHVYLPGIHENGEIDFEF